MRAFATLGDVACDSPLRSRAEQEALRSGQVQEPEVGQRRALPGVLHPRPRQRRIQGVAAVRVDRPHLEAPADPLMRESLATTFLLEAEFRRTEQDMATARAACAKAAALLQQDMHSPALLHASVNQLQAVVQGA